MSQKIENNLINTLHHCKGMPLYESLLLSTIDVYVVKYSTIRETFAGEKIPWRRCPYCGIYFYEIKKDVVKYL